VSEFAEFPSIGGAHSGEMMVFQRGFRELYNLGQERRLNRFKEQGFVGGLTVLLLQSPSVFGKKAARNCVEQSMRTAISGILILGCAAALGQATDNLTFEVAAIRAWPQEPHEASSISGGPGRADPTRMTWTGQSLLKLLWIAYDLPQYQVTGPDWLMTERYDIFAKVPPGATKEQANVMLQNLLKERFRLVAHYESKEFPVEELTVAPGGPKLKETDLDPNKLLPPEGDSNLERGPDGLLHLIAPGMVTGGSFVASRYVANSIGAKAQTMAQLARTLGNLLGHPVIDKTGLTAKYDFDVKAGPPATTQRDGASDPGPNLAAAVQKQLGLKLTKVKGKVDVLVIDKANKIPAEN
jgi:uncharacterized protein (TIGR03435 family)